VFAAKFISMSFIDGVNVKSPVCKPGKLTASYCTQRMHGGWSMDRVLWHFKHA